MIFKVNKLKLILIFVLFPCLSLSQTLTGTVKDSLDNPLQNANVIAKPLVDNAKLSFIVVNILMLNFC